MIKPPEATRHHKSIKLFILLSLRAIYFISFQYEAPCISGSSRNDINTSIYSLIQTCLTASIACCIVIFLFMIKQAKTKVAERLIRKKYIFQRVNPSAHVLKKQGSRRQIFPFFMVKILQKKVEIVKCRYQNVSVV